MADTKAKKGMSTQAFSFQKTTAFVFLFIYLSPMKLFCENTLKVSNFILIAPLCKTRERRQRRSRMKTNR